MHSSQAKSQVSGSRAERLRRRGRTVGLVAFAVVVTALTALWGVQIILQVLAPEPVPAGVECRPGVRALIAAVRRARRTAALETGGERAAIARFRAALDPDWQAREQLTQTCRGDREATRALREVDLLRYAEEHAVRYEAVELARRRRRIRAVEARLFGAETAAAPSQTPPAQSVVEDGPLSH